jgi:hypothetical protein
MTTFAGQMDFTGPQPFNVEIEAEEVPCQPVGAPLLGPSMPVVAQEITADVDLYPPRGRGVRVRRSW